MRFIFIFSSCLALAAHRASTRPPNVLRLAAIGATDAHALTLSNEDRQAVLSGDHWSQEPEWSRTPPLRPTVHDSAAGFATKLNCTRETAYAWGVMQPTRKGGVMFTYYHYFWEFAFPTFTSALEQHAAHGGASGVIISTTSEDAWQGAAQPRNPAEASDFMHPEYSRPEHVLNHLRQRWLGLLPAALFVREGLGSQRVCVASLQLGYPLPHVIPTASFTGMP